MKTRVFKTMLFASAASVGFATTSFAATVDFAAFSEGTVLGLGTNLGGGIVADISAVGGINQAVVFDTRPGSTSTGNDPDLTSPFADAEGNLPSRSFGNALIVQENQNGGPDDAVPGELTFVFAQEVSLTSLFMLDSESGSTAKLFSNGSLVKSFMLDASNESDTNNTSTNNEFTFLDFEGAVGDTLEVFFNGSGALGEFVASIPPGNNPNPVPLPASLPLLLVGAGAFAAMRRRKNR